jgi:hypothetical protein
VAGIPPFSAWLLGLPEVQSAEVRARIALAKERIQKVLDRERVAHQKTLEQKISDQGPVNQRVDPHLLGLAIKDLLELGRLKTALHAATTKYPWYANLLTPDAVIQDRLGELAPLYAQVSGGGFGNLTGDALEVIIFKCLREVAAESPRYAFQGFFKLDDPKDAHGRYRKVQPPKTVADKTTAKEADFLQFGHDAGVLCLECKNYREWIYPHHGALKDTIVKAYELGCIPLFIARRIHYTAMTNLLGPAGIIAHEAYAQYYPADQADLAAAVKDKTKLGFTDVTASEEPPERTMKFFKNALPKIVPKMAEAWEANRDVLYEFAKGEIHLAQLYNEIGSPAAGNWVEPEQDEPS